MDRACELGTGARGLRSVIESTMLEIMFHVHTHSDVGVCRITAATVVDAEKPIYEKRKASA